MSPSIMLLSASKVENTCLCIDVSPNTTLLYYLPARYHLLALLFGTSQRDFLLNTDVFKNFLKNLKNDLYLHGSSKGSSI